MKMIISTFFLVFFILTCVGFSQGQASDDMKWFGTFYLRPELDARDFSNETHPYFITLQRVAFGFEKQIYPNIIVFAEAMDSRIWGQPQNPRKSIMNLDLHQGYLKFINVLDMPIDLQIGRFEKEFNKKVIGPSNWQDVPRAFDGFDVKFKINSSWDIDAFYLVNAFQTALIPSTLPSAYPYPAPADKGVYAYGLTSKINFSKNSYIQPIAMLEVQGKGNATTYDKLTTAVDYINKEGNLDIWLHAGFQTGTTTTSNVDKDIAAWGAHAYLGYDLNTIKPMLIIDLNSGTKSTDQSTKENTYSHYLGNKHAFWGIADYFNTITTGTANFGLNQIAIRLNYNEKEPFSAYIEGSYFMTNVPFTNLDGKESTNIGMEADIVLKYAFNKKMFIDWGNAIMLPGDLWKALYKTSNGTVREDVALYTYLRFMFNF